jgi:hypothetical protein
MALAYYFIWRKNKQSKFKEIIKNPSMFKALAAAYAIVFGIFIIVILILRQTKA